MGNGAKDVGSVLEELIRQRDELNVAIKILQGVAGGETSATPVRPASPTAEPSVSNGDVSDPMSVVYPGMFFGKTQPAAVKLLLEKVRRPLKVKVIREALEKGGMKIGGKNPSTNLWSVLKNKRNSDTFILVPNAGWDLCERYDPAMLARWRSKAGKSAGSANGDDKDEEKKPEEQK